MSEPTVAKVAEMSRWLRENKHANSWVVAERLIAALPALGLVWANEHEAQVREAASLELRNARIPGYQYEFEYAADIVQDGRLRVKECR